MTTIQGPSSSSLVKPLSATGGADTNRRLQNTDGSTTSGFEEGSFTLRLGGQTLNVQDGLIRLAGHPVGRVDELGQYTVTLSDQTFKGDLGELLGASFFDAQTIDVPVLERINSALPAFTPDFLGDASHDTVGAIDQLVTSAAAKKLSAEQLEAAARAVLAQVPIPAATLEDPALLAKFADRAQSALACAKDTELPTARLVRVLLANPEIALTTPRAEWADALERLDAGAAVVNACGLGDTARAAVNQALLSDSTLSAQQLIACAKAAPDQFLARLDVLDLSRQRQVSVLERDQLLTALSSEPAPRLDELRALLDRPATQRRVQLFDLVTTQSATSLARERSLDAEHTALLTEWMKADPLLPRAGMKQVLERLTPEALTVALDQVKSAIQFSEDAGLPEAQRSTLVRTMAADPGLARAELEQSRKTAPDAWGPLLTQLDGAQNIATLLGASSTSRDVLRQVLRASPETRPIDLLQFAEENPVDWRQQLEQLLRDAMPAWNPTGPRDAGAPSTIPYTPNPARNRFRLGQKPVTAADTTGDTRNKDMANLGDLFDRYLAFRYDQNGVNYRDASPEAARRFDTQTYLARQLSDQAKALGYSFQNKAGDTAAQLGVYLDMLGVTDVTALRVRDNRVIDTITGKDLGRYDTNDVFSYSSLGSGWTDFLGQKLENDQLLIVPRWGDSSDVKKIAAVASLALAFTGVGSAIGTSLLSSAGASAGFLASTTGTLISNALSNAVFNTAVGVLSGDGGTLKTFAQSFATSALTQGLALGADKVIGGITIGEAALSETWAGQALMRGVGNGLSSAALGDGFSAGFTKGAIASVVSSGTQKLVGSSGLDLGWSPATVTASSAFLASYLTNGNDLRGALGEGARAYAGERFVEFLKERLPLGLALPGTSAPKSTLEATSPETVSLFGKVEDSAVDARGLKLPNEAKASAEKVNLLRDTILDASAIAPGSAGNSFLLATLKGIAQRDPGFLDSRMTFDPSGDSVTVQLADKNGQPVSVQVSTELPEGADVGSKLYLFQKAIVAALPQLLRSTDSSADWSTLENGGRPDQLISLVTGRPSVRVAPAFRTEEALFEQLQQALQRKDPVVVDFGSNTFSDFSAVLSDAGLMPHQGYTVLGVTSSATGERRVRLWDPTAKSGDGVVELPLSTLKWQARDLFVGAGP